MLMKSLLELFFVFCTTKYVVSSAGIGSLPLNEINIVTVTDVHSWVAGHGYHEKQLNADYGDVLAFFQHLQQKCKTDGRDLFLVMNGDFMDGTGLTSNPPHLLIPILQKMPWDAVNVGNHELYLKSTVDFISTPGGFIDHLKGSYLTSNVRHAITGDQVGSRAKFLKGEFGSTILTFGFLFDMTDENESVLVDKVEDVVQQSWFIDLLQGKGGPFDAILVLAHMDVRDSLVSVILNSIREICGENVPIQFITGHSHYRGFQELDEKSVSFEAGRYLDTVGFVSFSKSGDFHHVFIDANVKSLASAIHLKNSQLTTPDGEALSNFIHETQVDAGLLDVLACSPQNFFMNRTLDEPDSLFAFYLNNIISQFLFEGNTSKILIQGRGDFRYDLFSGNVTVTDLKSVSPFGDKFNLIADHVQGSTIESLISLLNSESAPPVSSVYYSIDKIKRRVLPNYFRSGGHIGESNHYEIYTADFHAWTVSAALRKISGDIMIFDPITAFNFTDSSQIWIDYLSNNWRCSDLMKERGAIQKTKAVRVFFAVLLLGGGTVLFGFVIHKFVHTSNEGSRSNFDMKIEEIENYDTIGRQNSVV